MIDPDDDSERSIPNGGDDREKTLHSLSYHTPIEYAPLPARSTRLPTVLIVFGAAVFVLGLFLFILALNALNQTQTPGYSFGPNAYVFDLLRLFAAIAIVVLCIGATLYLIGRKLYKRRTG